MQKAMKKAMKNTNFPSWLTAIGSTVSRTQRRYPAFLLVFLLLTFLPYQGVVGDTENTEDTRRNYTHQELRRVNDCFVEQGGDLNEVELREHSVPIIEYDNAARQLSPEQYQNYKKCLERLSIPYDDLSSELREEIGSDACFKARTAVAVSCDHIDVIVNRALTPYYESKKQYAELSTSPRIEPNDTHSERRDKAIGSKKASCSKAMQLQNEMSNVLYTIHVTCVTAIKSCTSFCSEDKAAAKIGKKSLDAADRLSLRKKYRDNNKHCKNLWKEVLPTMFTTHVTNYLRYDSLRQNCKYAEQQIRQQYNDYCKLYPNHQNCPKDDLPRPHALRRPPPHYHTPGPSGGESLLNSSPDENAFLDPEDEDLKDPDAEPEEANKNPSSSSGSPGGIRGSNRPDRHNRQNNRRSRGFYPRTYYTNSKNRRPQEGGSNNPDGIVLDPSTKQKSMVVSRGALQEVLKNQLKNPFGHRHLSSADFPDGITGENGLSLWAKVSKGYRHQLRSGDLLLDEGAASTP